MSVLPINPYAPPEAAEQPFAPGHGQAPPPYQLYSLIAVTLAGFLGALLSACILVALNYLRLGKTAAGCAMIGLGAAAFGLNTVLVFALPDSFPDWPFYLAHTGLSYGLAMATGQAALARDHQARGGRLASVWWAVGIAIGLSLLQLALFLLIMEVVPDKYLGIE